LNSDTVRQAYAAYPYGGGVVRETHPARLAAVAGLYGLSTPDLRRARVLELGCSRGFKLLPWAEQFPSAHFVGVDFSAVEIAEGRKIATTAGLTNVELFEADLCDYQPPPGSFDYIIAHGVFSWVPDAVKAALLALCQRALSAEGIACISYNTYPGWKKIEPIRDLLLMVIGTETDPTARLGLARATLDRLERQFAGKTDPHALAGQAILRQIRSARERIYHDELSLVNDPCYFRQFVSWADEYDLGFVGEAEFETVLSRRLQAAEPDLCHDRLQAEQWADYASDRTLRGSLLAHRDVVASLRPDPASGLRQCCFGANLRPTVGLPDFSESVPVMFQGDRGVSFTSEDPIVKALYTVLADAWPRRVAFDDLLAHIERLLGSPHSTPAQAIEPALLDRLLDGCGRRLLDFLNAGATNCVSQVSPRPRVSRLNRVLAKRNQPVSTPWHEPVAAEPAVLQLISSLNGERNDFTPAERKRLEGLAQVGLLLA
jgi:hypothetical protein